MGLIRKVPMLLLILFSLAGEFNLNRLPGMSDISFEIRWIILVLLCLSLIIFYPAIHTQINKISFFFIVVSLVFMILIFLTTFYVNRSFNIDELISYILTLIVTPIATILCVMMFASKQELIEYIAGIFMLLGLCYSSIITVTSFLFSGRGSIIIGGPNVATRIIFFAAISSLYLFNQKSKVIYLYTFIFCLIGILLLGSRGGFVGAAVALTTLFVISLFNRNPIKVNLFKKIFGIISGITLLGLPLYDRIYDVFSHRIIERLIEEQYTAGRGGLWEASLAYIKQNIVSGYGVGCYYDFFDMYPHNIFLEVMLNAGLIGLFAFSPIIIYCIILLFKAKNTRYYFFAVLPIYMIVVSSFSGDMYGFRYYYFWVIVLSFLLFQPVASKEKEKLAGLIIEAKLGSR